MKTALATIAPIVLLVVQGWAREVTKPPDLQVAAASQPSGRADWQQWDAFLTFVVKRMGRDLSGNLRENLVDIFLDARYELVQSLKDSQPGSRDPVPGLFLSTMSRLAPLLRQASAGLASDLAPQYNSFVSGIERLTFLGGIGLRLGLTTLSPDTLRGLARALEPTTAVDPIGYSLDIDSALRTLLGFTDSLPPPRPSPAVEQSHLRILPFPDGPRQARSMRSWFVRGAFAAEPEVSKLNQWVPDTQELEAYLHEVRDLLKGLGEETLTKSQLTPEFQMIYRNMVFATAWQESCWRQFVRRGEKLATLRSGTGDVGLMQINQNVWRGVYDVTGLVGDIEYNGRAGAEVLYQYFTRYAIRKGEHKQPGGLDNLPRATYGAYNGGPRHLTRYRDPKTSAALKKVDDLFWQKYSAVSAGREMEVQRCYGR